MRDWKDILYDKIKDLPNDNLFNCNSNIKKNRAEYQREWYYKNIEKRQAENRAAYHRNKDKHIDQKKINNKMYYLKKKGITLQSQEPKIVTKRFMNINEILDILRKDMKHELWNKSVRRWTDEDWYKFSLI